MQFEPDFGSYDESPLPDLGGISPDLAADDVPAKPDYNSLIGVLGSRPWQDASPENREFSASTGFRKTVEALSSDKERKIPFAKPDGTVGEAPMYFPNGSLTSHGMDYMRRLNEAYKLAPKLEGGGVVRNMFSGKQELHPVLDDLLNKPEKDTGPLSKVGQYVQSTRTFDEEGNLPELKWEDYVEWYNAGVKSDGAKIDPKNKELANQFYRRAKEADFDPTTLGDRYGELINGRLALNPLKYNDIDGVESFIANHKDLTAADKKLALLGYRSTIEKIGGDLVLRFAAKDAGILGSYFGMPLIDEFIKNAANPEFSFYDYLKANKERFMKDKSLANEVAQTFKDSLMSTATGALFWVGKGLGAAGWEGAEKTLTKPAEAHGWLAEQRMQGFDNEGVAFSVGSIDITRRDLTELTGQVGSFVAMGGLGRLAVMAIAKIGLTSLARTSGALQKAVSGAAAMAADDVALATTKSLGVKGLDKLKAFGLDATAYAAGLQASGMSFGRTHAQVMEQTGDDDEAFREASIQGISDGLSAFIATGVMNRFGMGAEAAFGGASNRASGGLFQRMRARSLTSEGRKAAQEALKGLAGAPKELTRAMSRELVKMTNQRAQALGLRGWGVLGGAVSEGIEEAADEVISTAIQAMFQDSKSWSDEFWTNVHDNWQGYVKAGILGALGGMGGNAWESVRHPVHTFGAHDGAVTELKKFHQRMKLGLESLNTDNAVVFEEQTRKFSEFIGDQSMTVKEKARILVEQAESRFLDMTAAVVPEGTVEAREASKAALAAQSQPGGQDASQTPTVGKEAASVAQVLSKVGIGDQNTRWKKNVTLEEGGISAESGSTRYVQMVIKGDEETGDAPAFVRKIEKGPDGQPIITDLSLAKAKEEVSKLPKGFRDKPKALRNWIDSTLKQQQQSKTDVYAQWKEPSAADNGNRGKKPAPGETADGNRSKAEAERNQRPASDGGTKPPRRDDTGASAQSSIEDAAIAGETNKSLLARTQPGPERDAAFTARRSAAIRVVDRMKPGDVVIDEDTGESMVVERVIHGTGKVFFEKEGEPRDVAAGLTPDMRNDSVQYSIGDTGASSRQVSPEEKKAIDDVAIMEDEELLKAATAPLTGGRNMVKEKARERLESEGRWDDVSGMPKLAPGTVVSYPRKEGDKTVEQEATFVGYDANGKAVVEYDGKTKNNVSLRGARVKALPKAKPPTTKQDGTQQEDEGQVATLPMPDAKAQAELTEDDKQRQEALKEVLSLVADVDGKSWGMGPSDGLVDDERPFVFMKVGKGVLPFYRSSKGTSGKKKGGWSPFFGVGKKETGDWIIKGNVEDIDNGYSNQEIQRIQGLLNRVTEGRSAVWAEELLRLNIGDSKGQLGLRQASKLLFGKAVFDGVTPYSGSDGHIQGVFDKLSIDTKSPPLAEPAVRTKEAAEDTISAPLKAKSIEEVAKELGVKIEIVDSLPENTVTTNAKTGEKSDTLFGTPKLGVLVDRGKNVFVTQEAAKRPELLQAKIAHAIKDRVAKSGKPVKAPEIADVKEDTVESIADDGTVVISPELLPGGIRSGQMDTSGGRWDQVRVGAGIDKKTGDTGTEYFTYSPAPGMELTMAPGDVVLIGGDKTRVLILEDSFNNLRKRSENRPKDFQGRENKKGRKTQGAYRFRLVDLSVGVGGVTADTRGLPERTKRRLDTINNRFWRSTLHTVSDSFASSIPKLLDGSITEKEVGALLDGVVAQVAPGLKGKIKKRKLSDAEGYIHYNKADGMVHVDMGKFRERLALRYGRGSFGNINANNPVAQKLIAMDVAQMVGHIINEEGIHEAAAKVFSDDYLADFYDQLNVGAVEGEFFRNLMKQIAFGRKSKLFGKPERWQDIDLGAIDARIQQQNERLATATQALENDDADVDAIALEMAEAESQLDDLKAAKVDLSMEMVRAAYQLVHTGTTTERHAAEVSGLFAAMNEDSDPGKKTVAKGFLKTLALLVKRYAQRIRTVLMLRYHQGHLPEGYTDILAKLHTSYTDLGYRGDTEMIQLGAAERSQDIADFTYSRMMDEIGYIGRAHNEALTRLRELPAKLYMDGSKRLEDILEVNPDDMTLRIRESARSLMEDSEYKGDVEAIDAALAELNSVEWNGNTSFGKAMLHASLLREVADMRLAALDFNPTGIFTFDTRNVDKPDNARLRIMAEIASGMRSDSDLGNVLMQRMERDLANIGAQIESARSTLFLSLLQETAALDVNTATGRRRLMQIARGVVGISSRGESLYQRFTGGQSDETIRQSLEDLRGQIIESLTIEQAADKIRDTGVPVPLFDSKRTVKGAFKTEQLLGPAKMKVLKELEAEKQYREQALAFFRQRGDQDEQVLRNRAEILERTASLLEESDPREAEVMRFQARLTREQIGVDQNEARRRYNDFKAYIEANNEFNDAIQHAVNTAIGQSYKDPTGFGLSWHSTLPTQPTDPKTGQPLPNNKLPDITPDSPPSEAFLQQVVSRTDTAADKGMDYASKSAKGRKSDNEWIEPSAKQIKERDDYRSIIESNAAFFGREHYRTAMRDFMAGHVGADDDFLAYFSTAGLNLSYVTEEDSGRIRYESWDNIFRKMPGFGRIFKLKDELNLFATKENPKLEEGRTPEIIAKELVEFATQAKQWLENLERVTDGVVERIGKEATLGMRISRFMNGEFLDVTNARQSTLSEARNQIRLFTNELFNVLSTAGGFVGARGDQGPDSIRNLELQPTPNIENLKAAMPGLATSLMPYLSEDGLFFESIRALGSAARISSKALHEFHDGTAGSGVGWRENVRREIQRTIDNPAYIPEHPDFAQLRDTPIDLSTFNKLSFALRYFEKSTSYFAGPGWAFEYLQKINVAQARGDGGEPFVDREGNVQERSRLGPDNRPAAVFNQGQTANTVAAWTEQSVAPGFGETESFQTPQERDARNRARPANALKSAVTEALMMIGYHSEGDRKSSFGDRSAENAQRFTQQVFAHAIPSVPTGQLASPMNLVRRGVRGAFPALADEEIDGVVEEFLAKNPIYETLEAMRSTPSVTELGQVANDGRIDPETFVTDILEFKSRFERSALESARIKRGDAMALAHNALLAVALRGDWNKGKEKDSANLLEESKAFMANFQQRDAGRLEKLSDADYEAESQQIRTGQAAVHDKYRKMTIGSIRIGRAAGEGTSGNIPWHTLLTEDQRADYQAELSELQTRWDALQDRKRASDRKARIRELASAGASIDLFVKEWTESNVTDNPSVTEEESFELVKFMQHAFLHGDGTLPVYDVRSAPFASWGYLSDNALLSHLLESVPATRLVNGEPVPVKTIVIAPDDAYLTRHGKGLLKTGLGLTFIPGTGTLPNIIYAPQGLRSARGEQAGSLIARTLVYHANNNPDALQEVMAMGNKINEVMTNALDLTAFMSSTGIGSALFTKFGKEVSQSPEVSELFEQAKTKQKAQLREALGRHYRQLTAMAKVMNMTKRTVSLQSLDPKMDNWKRHENAALIGELLSNKEFKTFFDHAMMDQVELLDGGLAPQVADSLLSAIKNVGLGSPETGEIESLDVGPQDIADRTITQQAAAAEDQYRLDEDEDEEAGRDDFVEYFESMLEELGWEGAEESSDSETAPENTLPSTIGLARLLRAIVEENDGPLSESQAEALAVSDATRFLFNGLANIFRSSDFGNWVADHAAMDKQIGKTRFRSKEHLLASAKDRRRSAPIFGHEQSLRGGRRVFVGDVANLVYPRVGSHTPMKGMMDPARYNNTAAVLTAKLEGVKSRILNLAGRSVERMQADGLDYAPAMEHAVALDQATIAELDNLLPQVPVEVDGEIVMTGAVTARIAERRRANQSLLESRLETIEAIRMLDERIAELRTVNALPDVGLTPEQFARMDRERVMSSMADWFVGEANAMLASSEGPVAAARAIAQNLELFVDDEAKWGSLANDGFGGSIRTALSALRALEEAEQAEIDYARISRTSRFGQSELSQMAAGMKEVREQAKEAIDAINNSISQLNLDLMGEAEKLAEPLVGRTKAAKFASRVQLRMIRNVTTVADFHAAMRGLQRDSRSMFEASVSALAPELVDSFGAFVTDSGVEMIGSRSTGRRPTAKQTKAMRDRRSKVRRILTGWILRNSKYGEVSRERVLTALRDGFGLRQEMLDSGRVVPFDFLDAMVDASALSSEDVRRQMSEALDPAAQQAIVQLESRRVQLEKSLAKANAEIASLQGETKNDQFIGSYYHTHSYEQTNQFDEQSDVRQTKVRADLSFRHPDTVAREDDDGVEVVAADAFGNLSPEQKMDWHAVSTGAIEALKDYAKNRVDDVYKRLRGHPDTLKDFDPVKLLERAVRIVDSDNAIMAERMQEARTAAEEAQMRGMTIEATTLITDPSEMEVYQRGKSGRIKRYRLPKSFRERRQHIGRLFNVTDPNGQMVPIVLVSRNAREDLMKYFPAITKRNVESRLYQIISKAADLGGDEKSEIDIRKSEAKLLGIDYPVPDELGVDSDSAYKEFWKKHVGGMSQASKEQWAIMTATPYAVDPVYRLPVFVGAGPKGKPDNSIYFDQGSLIRRFLFDGVVGSVQIASDNSIHFSINGSLGLSGKGAFRTMNAIMPYVKQLVLIHNRVNPNTVYSFHGNDERKFALFQRYTNRSGFNVVGDNHFSVKNQIYFAADLGSNYDVQSDGETPSFFMRYANEVRGNAFNAGLELKNRLSAETQAFFEEGKTNREVADRFVAKMQTDVLKRLEDEMRSMDNQNPAVKQRKFDTSGETTQAILRQYSEMLRLLVYAWNNEALTTGTNSGREKLLNLIVAIDKGDFIRNPRKYRVEDVLAKVFSDIEGQAILQEMTAGIIGINSPTSRFFHKYFHHHDARIRRRFLKKRAARETARRLMNLLDRGVDGLSGRAAYEAAKKNSENRIAGAAKELGFSAREHTLGYVIAQLKGLDSRFGYAYGNAFVNWYRAIQAGNYQLGQLDTAQKAKFGDGARRYFQANHLDIVRDTKLAQEVLSIIEQANPDEVINRFESEEDQVYNEEEYRNLANDIIRRLEAASAKGKEPVNSYADTINDVFIDIGNAMHVAQFFVSQDSKSVKVEKKWKDMGAPEFRHSYSSVPVRLGYASDPNADEDKRSKREGAFAEDPADILAFREASFFNGLGKNAGTEQGRTVYRPLVINGLTAPIGMVDDALFRLYVTPSYEVARRMVGRSVEDRHGLQTVVDQDSYMMQNAQDMPEEWRNKHLSDSDSSLSTVASEMETIIRNETQYGVVNTGFAETARWLSSSYIARSLASAEQFWNQSIGPVVGYLAKKAVVGDWQGIRDFLDVYARQFPSAVKSWTEGKKQSGEQSDLFIDALTKFVRDVDLFVYYRAHEVSDEKSQTIRKQFRGNRGKVVGAAGTAAKVYEAWGEKMLGWTIGGPERLLGRAIFLSEIRSELRRRNSPLAEMPVDELIKHADQIDSSVGSYARTKVNDMLGQSDQAKKGWLFQSRDSSPVMSTLWKSITRFSNHTASTASNLNTFVPVIFERKIGSKFSGKQSKYDDATYQEALENVTGTLVQNILFSMLKPKMLVPSLAYLFYMLGGDDDDKAQREAQKLANKLMTVDEDEGVTAGNVTKALLFGRQKELFMQTKSPDAAQASAMAEMLNNALREAAPAIPVVGVGFGYFWGQKLSSNLITEPVSKELTSLATGVEVSGVGRFDRKGINIREYQPGALEALAETSAPAAALYDAGDAAVRSVRAGQTGEFNFAEIATYLAAEALPPFRELRSYYQKRMQDEIRLRNLQ